VRKDIIGAMRAKWVFITSVGAVTFLMRAPVGDIVAVPGGERFVRSGSTTAWRRRRCHRLPRRGLPGQALPQHLAAV
jgi:hypothetical protein